MSSTLTVTNLTATNLTDGAGTTSTFANVNSGTAKAWMTMTGDGSAIDDSFNTSSLTDTATGQFTQNYTNSFNNVHYSWCGQQESTFSVTGAIIAHNHSTKTVSGTELYTYVAGSGGNIDTEENCTQVQGDLA